MKVVHTKKFETKATIHIDVTAYGNKYWMQFEDDKFNDHEKLGEFLGGPRKVTIIIEADCENSDD